MHARTAAETRAATDRAGRAGPLPAALAVVLAATALGAVLRVLLAREALFADELSSFWIVTSHGLPDVLRVVASDAEITPPLFFVLSWASTLLGDGPLLVRAPSLVAGVLTVPALWWLGRRVVGAAPAVVAAAVCAGSPFMAYYAAEARGYAVMMLLLVVSTAALLRGADGDGRRWWVLHALATAGAMYAHYTAVFVLAAQFGWTLWRRPAARRALVAATAGAVLTYLPWVPGALADLASPTQAILDALSPLTWASVRSSLEHWSLGYPYAVVGLRDVPGLLGLVPIALALAAGLVALVLGARRRRPPAGAPAGPGRRDGPPRELLGLVVLLAVVTPAAEIAASLVGSNLFSTRNLAPSSPYLLLAAGALVGAVRPAGPRAVVAALLVVGTAIGGARTLERDNGRPDTVRAARLIESAARPGDVVVDQTGVLSPGPLTALDAALEEDLPIVRAGTPTRRDRPFAYGDDVPTTERALAYAARSLGPGARIFLIGAPPPDPSPDLTERERAVVPRGFPAGFRLERQRVLPDFTGGLRIQVLAR